MSESPARLTKREKKTANRAKKQQQEHVDVRRRALLKWGAVTVGTALVGGAGAATYLNRNIILGTEASREEPVFYENWPDNNHCLQASMMSVLNSTGHTVSWDEVNRETQYQNGLYSWNIAGADAISKRIPGTVFVSPLDYRAFSEKGEEYLRGYMRPEWFQLQKNHASPGFKKEQEQAKNFLRSGVFEHGGMSLEKIERYFPDHLLIALVNADRLDNKPGNAGHSVVVYKKDHDSFTLHDPGLPPKKGWVVSHQQFMSAFEGDMIVIPKVPKK